MSEQVNHSPPEPSAPAQGDRRHALRLLALSGLAFGLSGTAVLTLMRDVRRKDGPTAPSPVIPEPELHRVFFSNWKILEADTQSVELGFNQRFEGILARMEADLKAAGERFAEDKITRVTLAMGLFFLAQDQTDEGDRFDAWINELLEPYFEPVQVRYAALLDAAVTELVAEMATAIEGFNDRLGLELAAYAAPAQQVNFQSVLAQSTEEFFINRGFVFQRNQVIGLGAMALGSGVVLMSRLLAGKFLILRRVFLALLRPLALRASARAAAAGVAVSVPPAGLAIGIAGGIWSGVDFIRLKGQARRAFARELERSIASLRTELTREVKHPVNTLLAETLKESNTLLRKVQQRLRS